MFDLEKRAMRPSLIDPWAPTSYEFFEVLGFLDRQERYDVLDRIRSAELMRDSEAVEARTTMIEAQMRLSPLVPPDQCRDAAYQSAVRALKRSVHTANIMSQSIVDKDVTEMVDVDSFAPILEAAKLGPTVVLPIHCGAIEAFVMILSAFVPVTLIVSHGSGVPTEIVAEHRVAVPNIDLEILRAPGPRVLVQALRAARSGRVLVFPPEFTSKRHDVVVRYRAAGVDVAVPSGYAQFAERLNAPMFPVLFTPTPEMTYQVKTPGAVDPTEKVDGVSRGIVEVFNLVDEVLADDLVDWEGWQVLGTMKSDLSDLESAHD